MSENYIVSARKYRPQTFDTVVGQGHITTTLKNAIRNKHLAHAYLFCGPRGVGKTTCARILARTINCESPTADMEACGTCSICTSFRDNTSFNVFELDAASNNSVDDIRELTSQVRFAPQHGRYKVYIIDEVHMLSAAAFNAFLKTLEEPPPYAIFILATTEKHKILPTILSRCQIFDFRRITTDDTVAHLQSIAAKEHMVANEAALHVIAQKSEGCMRDALSMLDRIASFTNGMLTYANTMEHLNMLDADFYFRLTDLMLCQDVAGTLLQLDAALERGFEGDVIISGLAEHFRNLMLCKDTRMAKLLDVPGEHRQLYYEKANQTPPSYIISALNVVGQAELEYRNATNRRLHVEMCLIRLCYLLQAVNGASVAMAGEKKNFSSLDALVGSLPVATATAPVQTPTTSQPVHVTPPATVVAPSTPSVAKLPETPPQLSIPPSHTAIPPAAGLSQLTKSSNAGAQAPPASRKVSMNLLGGLDEAISEATAALASGPRVIDPIKAAETFEAYKQELHKADKGVLMSQFAMMKIEVLPPDEVRIISPHLLTDTYAKEQRNTLIDFFCKTLGMTVRITNEIREDESFLPEENKVLSRSEIFDVMVATNPNLARLRDGLGLQIEY
jgi:DNA polymerase-3 subunit gamma/tau